MPPRKLTLGVLAKRLKLSKATVSKALNPHADRSDISVETTARVRVAAARLGWHPDQMRAARARRRMGNIGLVCQRAAPFTGGVYGDFLDGLSQALATHSRRLLFVPALEAGDWSRLLNDQRIDGAILMEPIGESLMTGICESRFPAVLINQSSTLPLPQILCDDVLGSGLAVSCLAAAGHQRLAFIQSPTRRPHYSVASRVAGFHAACVRLDVHGGQSPMKAEAFLNAWRQAAPATRATAVVCYNFSDTVDLLHGALERGLAIPGDLSVISCDDIPALAMLRPAVHAIQVPMVAMAAAAVVRLIGIIESGPQQGLAVEFVPPILAARGTVGPPPLID